MLGGLENESTICDSMREGAGVVVIDVNYRHCPGAITSCLEHRNLTNTLYRSHMGQGN